MIATNEFLMGKLENLIIFQELKVQEGGLCYNRWYENDCEQQKPTKQQLLKGTR